MKKLYILFAVLICSLIKSEYTLAQQDPMFTQYMFNALSVNPGYAGTRGTLNVTALSRMQWSGFDGAPKTQYLSLNTPVRNKKFGIGGTFIYDEIGPSKNAHLYLNYAYYLKLSSKATLSLGIKAGVNWFRNNLTDLRIVDDNDKSYAVDYKKGWVPNFGLGAYYYTPNFYVGLSVPRLVQSKLNSNENTVNVIAKDKRHYFLIAGYYTKISDEVGFKPSVLVKSVEGAPTSIDLSALFLFKDLLWAGPMWRIGDGVGGQILVKATDEWTIGYAFDIPLTKLIKYQSGTHEVMISFDFDKIFKNKTRSNKYF